MKRQGGQLHAAPSLYFARSPRYQFQIISPLPAPGNQPGNLTEISLSVTGTGREHHTIIQMLKLLHCLRGKTTRIEWRGYDTSERCEERTGNGVKDAAEIGQIDWQCCDCTYDGVKSSNYVPY